MVSKGMGLGFRRTKCLPKCRKEFLRCSWGGGTVMPLVLAFTRREVGRPYRSSLADEEGSGGR